MLICLIAVITSQCIHKLYIKLYILNTYNFHLSIATSQLPKLKREKKPKKFKNETKQVLAIS